MLHCRQQNRLDEIHIYRPISRLRCVPVVERVVSRAELTDYEYNYDQDSV